MCVFVCRHAWVCVGLWPMIIFILLCLVWSYVFLDIPSQWLKDKSNLGALLIKMNVGVPARIQQANGVSAQQAGVQTQTYSVSKWYICQSDWFTADATYLPVRELKLLVSSLNCTLQDFQTSWLGVAHFSEEGANLRWGLFQIPPCVSLFVHAAEGQRECPFLSHLSSFNCIPSQPPFKPDPRHDRCLVCCVKKNSTSRFAH